MFGIGFKIGDYLSIMGLSNPINITTPVITSQSTPITVGTVLECSNGTWAASELPIVFSYQWYLNSIPLVGETSNTYIVSTAGVYVCVVTATIAINKSTSVQSNSVTAIALTYSLDFQRPRNSMYYSTYFY